MFGVNQSAGFAQSFLTSIAFIPVMTLLSELIVVLATIICSINYQLPFNVHVIIGYLNIGIGSAYLLSHFTPLMDKGIFLGMTLGFLYSLATLVTRYRSLLVSILHPDRHY